MKDFITNILIGIGVLTLFFFFLVINGTNSKSITEEIKKIVNVDLINVDFGSIFSEKDIPLTASEKNLMNLKYDINKYPENIAFIEDGKTELSSEDKKLLSKRGQNDSWTKYSLLDRYGRARDVYSLVTYEAVYNNSSAVKERPPFASNLKIAGEYADGRFNFLTREWKGEINNNRKLQLSNYRGYLYNKSHLLAWSLGGDMKGHNVILGTRAQNVGTNRGDGSGGMGYAESIVRNNIYQNKNLKVYYHVKPVYSQKELIPRGVRVRAYSVNDGGKTINLDIWTFNSQDGVQLDYNNGKILGV